MCTKTAAEAESVAKVRIMYWKEIPVQIQAEDELGVVSRQLDDRFQKGVDALSMFDGSAGSDDYLNAWAWGEFSEAVGSAKETVDRLVDRINVEFPEDFVTRIRDTHLSRRRDPTPGALDGWFEDAE